MCCFQFLLLTKEHHAESEITVSVVSAECGEEKHNRNLNLGALTITRRREEDVAARGTAKMSLPVHRLVRKEIIN